jgi:hypothetical protein
MGVEWKGQKMLSEIGKKLEGKAAKVKMMSFISHSTVIYLCISLILC